jgi:uncharacterized protein (TIGR02611 family)
MRPSLIERLEARRLAHLERSVTYRVLFVFAGFVVLLAGLALLVLPGPGWPVIAIALAMLALEFAWAERLLRRALVRLEAAQRTANELGRLQRALVFGALALVSVGTLAVFVLWDVPLVPL